MTKKQKEEQEKIQWLNELINEKREFTKEQERYIKNFIFNILCSNTVLNRYENAKYGNTIKDYDNCITIYDCINYWGNKLKED